MITETKLQGLREMAKRGEPGEKANAIRILNKLGLPLEKPKESFTNRVKQTFGGNIIREYSIDPQYASDVFLLAHIVESLTPSKISINYGKVHFRCTPSQLQDIRSVYFKCHVHFSEVMNKECDKYIETYIGYVK